MSPRNPDNDKLNRLDRQLRPRLMAVAVASCFAVTPAFGLPTGGQVVAGSARFAQTGNSLVVTNTPGAIINWNSFSVGAIESVKFQQQNSLSAVLNRVTGSGRSDIQGALLSNGRVFLINPNGILFGPNSTVNVGGLIASTLDIADPDFKDGKLKFAAGASAGSLQNAGTLAAGKNIYLIAPDIENTGIIQSAKGEILLAAGRQVTLVDGAHPDIQVVISAPSDKAVNLGDIVAGNISVFGALIQQRGKMNADRAEVDEKGRIVFRASKQLDVEAGSRTTANGKAGGEIVLQTTAGDTYVRGTVTATGEVDAGGTVQVLGQRVAVMDQALIDASGERGGGTILLGGDYQGKNPLIQNSTVTYFGPDATLKANAGTKGDGGKVIVWADQTTRAYGSIEAKGGTTKGNGGFIETSGQHGIEVTGLRVDTTAPNGNTGTWLIDPGSLTLIAGPGADSGTTIYGDNITTSLGSSNVVVATDGTGTGDITFTAGTYAFSPSNAAANSVSFLAYGAGTSGNINLPAGTTITMAYGGITMVAGWDGTSTTTPVVASGATGGISILGSNIAVSGSQEIKLVAGSGGISTSGTGTGGSGEFLQGKIALDTTGAISVSKLDGDFVARSTGSGSAITVGDPGGMTVSSSAIGGVPAGVSSNSGPITLEAYGGLLYVAGPITASAGVVKLTASNAISLNNTVSTSGVISLVAYGAATATGAISQTSSGSLSGGSVSAEASTGNVLLDQAANSTGVIAGYGGASYGGGAAFAYKSANSINVTTIGSRSGISTNAGLVILESGYGGLAFTQSAPVSTTGLLIKGTASGQSATLTDSGNSFSQLAASFNSPTSVSINQSGAAVLTVDTLASVAGVTANGSTTKLNIANKYSTTGSLVINAPVNGGTTAEIELSANGILTINSSQSVSGKNVWLRSGDQITLTGSVTAAEWAMLANAASGPFTVSTGAGSYGGGYIAYGGLANISAGTGIALGQPDSAYGGTTSLTISAPITLSNKNLALLSYGGYIDITQPISLGTGKLIFEGGTVENIGTTITAAAVAGKATTAELYFGGNIAIESFTTPDSTPQTFNGVLTTGTLKLTSTGYDINDGGGTLEAPTLYLTAASLGTSAVALKTNTTTLGLSATGAGAYITNHTAASPGTLSVYGSAPNSAGVISITNYGDTYVTAPGVTGYGSVSISSSGLLTVPSTASVSSSYGGTSLTTTGAAPLSVYGSVSGATSVVLSSGGTLMIGGSPASVSSSSGTTSLTTTGGGTLTVVYGGSVSGATGVSLTASSGGTVTVDGSVSSSGTISVAAGSVSGTGTIGGTVAASTPFSSTTPVSGGGGGTTTPPPVDPCVADPASCVPTDPCVADPASCVPVDPCVANPSAPGCGSSGGVVIPTDPIGDKLACLIDPTACGGGGGTTDPNVGNTVKTALENIDSVEQTFTTTTTTGLTDSGKVELALGPSGAGGGGTAGATGTTGASGEPTGGSGTEENKDKDKTTATTDTGTPTPGAGDAPIPVKYCN